MIAIKQKKLKGSLLYVRHNYGLYLMLLPGFLSLLIFSFGPMFGFYLAFIDYNPLLPFFANEQVGLLWFRVMFEQPDLWNMVRNTLVLSGLKILIIFPSTIVLALLMKEVSNKIFKKIFQTVSYLPNFISWIIISGMMVILLDSDNGLLNKILSFFGGKKVSWYSDFRPWWTILTATNWWKNIGWGTIVYLAALSSVDTQLYEAATVDGAGRLRQVFSITLPSISSIISITLILTIGKLFQDDFEQIFALVGDNPILGERTEVISTIIFKYVNSGSYKDFPLSTAYGLVQGVISLALVAATNMIAKKMGQEGVW